LTDGRSELIDRGAAGDDASSAASAGTAAQASDTAVGPRRGNKWWTLVAVSLGTFMLLLDVTIINVALPDIQGALSSSFSGLQWVVDAYALTLAALLLTAGSLADLYGRRLLYVVGLVIFTLASLLCGLAASTMVQQFVAGTAMQREDAQPCLTST